MTLWIIAGIVALVILFFVFRADKKDAKDAGVEVADGSEYKDSDTPYKVEPIAMQLQSVQSDAVEMSKLETESAISNSKVDAVVDAVVDTVTPAKKRTRTVAKKASTKTVQPAAKKTTKRKQNV